MKRNFLKAKILTGIVTSFVLISSSSIAFAEEVNNEKFISVVENSNEAVPKDDARHNCNDDKEKHKCDKEKHKEDMKYSLESAMKDKVITAEEYDKIMKYINDKCDKKLEVNKKKDICDEFVDNNILTKETIDNYLNQSPEEVKTQLSSLEEEARNMAREENKIEELGRIRTR